MACVNSTVIVGTDCSVVTAGADCRIQLDVLESVVKVEGMQGLTGPKGAPGSATSVYFCPAGESLSGHQAVKVVGGRAFKCSATSLMDAGRAIGITTGAAAPGADASVQSVGQLVEPSWSWTEGPVYVGANGGLTQSLAGVVFVQQIGMAVSATAIDINPQLPILLS